MLVPVYDIQNCGPRSRFAANEKLVHNSDKINLQNLPSRGANANTLKKAIIAPKGFTLIDSDSSQIEARVLAWLAQQEDLVEAFAQGKDVYKKMASAIYNKPETDVTKEERFIGKTVTLGCGYGLGALKFQSSLKMVGVDTPLDEARRIIDVYRRANPYIVALWRQAQTLLVNLTRGDVSYFGRPGVLEIKPKAMAIKFPSGLLMRYDDLKCEEGENGLEFSYKTRKGRTKIYGGKCVENVCQGIARCIIGEQMTRIAKKYKVVMTVHDSIVCLARDEDADEAQAYVEECMRWTPDWAEGLPINCESGKGKTYGSCE